MILENYETELKDEHDLKIITVKKWVHGTIMLDFMIKF